MSEISGDWGDEPAKDGKDSKAAKVKSDTVPKGWRPNERTIRSIQGLPEEPTTPATKPAKGKKEEESPT